MDNAQDDTPFRLTHGIVGNTVGMIKEGSQVVTIPGGVAVVVVIVIVVVVGIVLAAARFIQYHHRLGIATTRTRTTSTTSTTVGYSGFRRCSGMGRVRDKARINQGHVFGGQGTR